LCAILSSFHPITRIAELIILDAFLTTSSGL
jgi:hypothetical protein